MGVEFYGIRIYKDRSRDRVGIITLNRPEVLNALSVGLTRELDDAITEIELMIVLVLL
ncbi:MAG: hypothetical protein CM1200mP35_05660 [Chloroflexota bacterium]|nr:MAG: hypothetical protein CM1200mP35_05660 [Chloroflexota bacterium]